ncbi:coagulation factor IX isoform X2 [Pseudoliparis swirei]|uniref:coagulation factor IX isoform X2 n=1 Tax=Pseudoliparis swirei TaxID=2059687 RepID=UPI0024BD6915|nr:coagulation factor IX isoform X2 [Pseudoliparis swirei]
MLLTWTLCSLLSCSALIECSVFLTRPVAARVLGPASRRRRANSFLLEEVLPGDLERECHEEACSQEEAAEIFQTREKTLEFWYQYINLNPCQTSPCLNGGLCSLDRGAFLCLCPPGYHGNTCALEVMECRHRNGGCMQYCRDLQGGATVQCGCADGFRLEEDGQSCSQTVAFPCGRRHRAWASYRGRSLLLNGSVSDANSSDSRAAALNLTEGAEPTSGPAGGNATALSRGGAGRIVGGVLEQPGGSPWQVLVCRSDGYGFCGGTLVSDRWVVSAAHCLEQTADHVIIGDYDKRRPDPGEQRVGVREVFVHPHFHRFTLDSDVALLHLQRPATRGPTALPACLPDPQLAAYLGRDNRGVVSGWGVTHYLGRTSSRFLRKVTLPVVSQQDCSASTEQVITDNMFCAGYLDAPLDACSGDSGGPFVVNYRGTWFLTGVVSWGEQCAQRGRYGVYVRLGNFLNWIRDTMERADLNATDS